MKTLFGGYGYSYPGPSSPSSPTRTSVWGSAYSPFRNTNMPLQDITMDKTMPMVNGTNARSPTAKSPTGGAHGNTPVIGAGGRTMKDYNDNLETLKKENFRLKLRIYFLEDRMSMTPADDDPSRKNIELKVEVESLRKELIEKQELLSQAAKAFELIEKQKDVSLRNQVQYQESLEKEQARIAELEMELEEYKTKFTDTSIYYQDTFGITPEKALEHKEKLHQMEEVVASLEAEVKQITASLEEERSWAHELEIERDQFRERLGAETRLREKLSNERDMEIEGLRERVKELEDEAFKRENIVQQQKNEIADKERVIKEKSLLLEETSRTCEEVNAVAEKRKKQVAQLRISIKSRDDALTDLNNKHRALLNQFEQNYVKRSSAPSSPLTSTEFDRLRPFEGSRSPRPSQKSSSNQSPSKITNSPFDWEPHRDRPSSCNYPSRETNSSSDNTEANVLDKEIDERDREMKRQEEAKKQLILKLCNTKKSAKLTEDKLKKLETEHEKALKMIQGLMSLQQKHEDKQLKKDRKIADLENELENLYKGSDGTRAKQTGQKSSIRRDLGNEMTNHPERDHTDQQRFEDMECKINELGDQIDSVKAEKSLLERQIKMDSEMLEEQLNAKEKKIVDLIMEKDSMQRELSEKLKDYERLKESYDLATERIEKFALNDTTDEHERLREELLHRDTVIDEKNLKIEQLTKDLQIKTQNLQKLVNTELWSKNKEIAKLHDQTMSANQSHANDASRGNNNNNNGNEKLEILQNDERANSQLEWLLKELENVGITVKFDNKIAQLNCANGNETFDVKTMTEYVEKLVNQKRELEREVDYLRWLKLVSQPNVSTSQELENCSFTDNERALNYCEILRKHVKDLFKFMKEMLKTNDYSSLIINDHRKIVLDVLLSSKTLYDDFVKFQDGFLLWDDVNEDAITRPRSLSTEIIPIDDNRKFTISEAQSDSEAFSEPDRKVSLARIGLRETQNSHKSSNRMRGSKYTKNFSDSEDSIDYVRCYKINHQTDVNGDGDCGQQIQQLVDTNGLLSRELAALREEIFAKVSLDDEIDEKLKPIIVKLEKSQKAHERLQIVLEKKMQDWNANKTESKHCTMRKAQLEKKISDVESMAVEMTKQKTELMNYKEDTDRKTADVLITLNRENEALRTRIKLLEEENVITRSSVSTITNDLDQLTLSHSQILVENTKLTNEKLKLEQELRKNENKYDMTVRSLQDKFNKQVTDLNQMNDAHRARLEELENSNKELSRHVVICESSDSAPSSSGVSSIPADSNHKQTCDDLMQDYHTYNGSQYWLSINYPTSTGRSKSSCSPDLGIESDAAVSTTRPLQDTLKITESMTNLLSDEDCNSNGHREMRDLDRDSPLHLEGLDEVEALKQENEVLKRRLMKTRRALEDTFQHLSASNKNKKNVEKAITKQLMMTKSILKKTRTYEETFD